MIAALRKDGELLITFGPPWWAPFGSHMQFFTKCPWVNILFSERTVMRVRSKFRSDGAMRYEDVDSGLNKMSVAKFERLLRKVGLRHTYKRYDCSRGLNIFRNVPGIRNLFINHISCILVKEPSP